jgi:guanine deaminase
MVGGKVVVRGGKHVDCDMAKLARDAQVARDEVAEANTEGKHLAQAIERAVGSFCIGLCREPFHLHRYGGPLGL